MNRIPTLPLIEDIKTLNTYLQDKIIDRVDNILDIPTSEALLNLSRATLALIIVFNRRRSGEVQRIFYEYKLRLHLSFSFLHPSLL